MSFPDHTLVTTRVLPFPREQVFGAFRDPEVLARWWGPHGFTNRISAFDFRPGGEWRVTMRGPDGAEMFNRWEFLEIQAPDRIHLVHHEDYHRFELTVTFQEEEGGTRLTWHLVLATPEEAEQIGHLVSAANEQNFDRLTAQLA